MSDLRSAPVANCECEHPHSSHDGDGHCKRCACNAFRRLLECANCYEVICVEAGLADDEGALCRTCGTKVTRDGA